MRQTSGLGNQQERLESDRRWFGGLFDGEGSLGLSYMQANWRTGRKKPSIGCRVQFVNTSDYIVSEVRRILTDAGVPFHVAERESTIGRKRVWSISCNGMKRCQRFIEAFAPYFRGKRVDAEIMRSYIESRLSKESGAPYSPEEIGLYRQMRELHGYTTRVSSETRCQALLQR